MIEKLLIQLDPERKWALGADSMQWIIYKVNTSKGKEVLQGRSFINWDQEILFRVMLAHGIDLTEEAIDAIRELPFTFTEFKEKFNPKSGKGRKGSDGPKVPIVSPALAKWNGWQAASNGDPRQSPHRTGTALAKEWFKGYEAQLEGDGAPYKPEKRQPKEEPAYG